MVGLLNLGVSYINSLVLFCYSCSALQANSLLDNRSHISNDYKRARFEETMECELDRMPSNQ